MRITEVIAQFHKLLGEVGDVELFHEENDGRSTWRQPYKPTISLRKIWPRHPDPISYYVENGL